MLFAHLHVLFGWFATGHAEITMWAVSGAVAVLDHRKLLERMGTGVTRMKIHLESLWKMDVCQDLDKGNILGKCGIDVPGGQVHHFMRDVGQSPLAAYSLSLQWIMDEAVESFKWFQKAFPEKKTTGFWGAVSSAGDAVKAGAEVAVAGVVAGMPLPGTSLIPTGVDLDSVKGQMHLGRALHTLQDAYSPAHTLRHDHPTDYTSPPGSSIVLRDIYAWDAANKTKVEGGWPGHWDYDLVSKNDLTTALEQSAIQASKDVIMAVLGNLYTGQAACTAELRQKLAIHLAKTF